MHLFNYENAEGDSPFAKWFNDLNEAAADRVRIALNRIEQGDLSNAKAVGEGVSEYKINFGPGYRIYFGQDGDEIIILLGGGQKKRQQQDIEDAQDCWRQYKREKKLEKK